MYDGKFIDFGRGLVDGKVKGKRENGVGVVGMRSS